MPVTNLEKGKLFVFDRDKIQAAYRPPAPKKQKHKYSTSIALELECIGSDRIPGPGQALVDKIIGISPDGVLECKRMQGFRDYTYANSVGSRGIHIVYILSSGNLYFVSSPLSWKKIDQYYCRIKDGQIVRMNIHQVLAWLKNHWA